MRIFFFTIHYAIWSIGRTSIVTYIMSTAHINVNEKIYLNDLKLYWFSSRIHPREWLLNESVLLIQFYLIALTFMLILLYYMIAMAITYIYFFINYIIKTEIKCMCVAGQMSSYSGAWYWIINPCTVIKIFKILCTWICFGYILFGFVLTIKNNITMFCNNCATLNLHPRKLDSFPRKIMGSIR